MDMAFGFNEIEPKKSVIAVAAVLYLPLFWARLGNSNIASSLFQSLRLSCQSTVEHAFAHRPEKPIRVRQNDLRQSPAGVLSEGQCRPHYECLESLWPFHS